MKKLNGFVFVVVILSLLIGNSAQASIIAFTSFEEPGTGSQYIDTLDSATDHSLVNNTGQGPVNYVSMGGELGFSSYYIATGGVGLTDGDFVGVTNNPGAAGSFPHGSQGFVMQDTDGIMITTLDVVNLTGYTNPTVSLDLFINDTGWETSDVVRAWVTVDGGIEIDLINTTGQDIDDLSLEDSWMNLQVGLAGYTTAQLSFELESNSTDETIWIDNIEFEGSPVPVPGAFWLLGTGLIAMIGGLRRRTKMVR